VAVWGRSSDEVSDDLLLTGLAAGDPRSSVAFVRRFQGAVFGIAVAVVGDGRLAEDVAQQAFERAWRHAALYDPRRGSVRAWLGTITHNLAVDAVRARPPTPMDPRSLDPLVDAVTTTPERAALVGESWAMLRSAIRALPPAQARALVMAALRGMTAVQVAAAEGIPVGTAKSRIRAALRSVRDTVAEQEADRG
jgi:RNA polymerase sigma factor (sigma-70 family)